MNDIQFVFEEQKLTKMRLEMSLGKNFKRWQASLFLST